jgi:hypothetical protein
MHANFAHVLVARGIIRMGTVLDAYHQVKGLSCARSAQVITPFIVGKACKTSDARIVFDALDPDYHVQRVDSDQVVRVDGMALSRLASAQNLTLEGVELSVRVRRGRRKKL